METNEKMKFGNDKNHIVLRVMGETTFNIRSGQAQDTLTTAGVQPENVSFDLFESEKHYVIKTSSLSLLIEKETLLITISDETGKVINKDHPKSLDKSHPSYSYKEIKDEEIFFGLGERTGFLNKRGQRVRFWNYAEPFHYTPIQNEMYQSIPFMICKGKDYAYGIYFDNSFDSFFDIGKENKEYVSFGADGGELNYYFFFGKTVKEVVEQYTRITGRTPMPPMWALGYHQSRWSYYPDKQVLALAQSFRDKEIPCDSIHLDIDYMDNYKVFTFDKNKFPNPKDFFDKMNRMGFKMITIVDPGIKKEEDYRVYEEGIDNGYYVKTPDGEVFIGDVWPGGCAFPDFANEKARLWWAGLNKELLSLGVKGIWNDLNEPSVLVKPHTMSKDVRHETDEGVKSHAEIHNLYANYEATATLEGFRSFDPEQRPFVLSRAGFAGIQKYAAIWTGDNTSSWDQLLLSVPMFLNLGLSGVPFVGADVGGYAGDCSEELLIRWMQLGAFTPLYRNHSRKLTVSQEPWAFGETAEAIIKKFIELRYRLLPYYYSVFRESHEKGYPILRPMFFDYENDPNTLSITDQFMVGESLLAAPIYLPDQHYRTVYLPTGKWYDYWSDKTVEGGRHVVEHANLGTMPLFVKEGSIIPEFPLMQYVGEKTVETITLHVYPGNGEFTYYEDDGETNRYLAGAFNKTRFTVNTEAADIEINVKSVHNGYPSKLATYRFVVHGIETIHSLSVNQQSVNFSVSEKGLEFAVSAADEIKIQICK